MFKPTRVREAIVCALPFLLAACATPGRPTDATDRLDVDATAVAPAKVAATPPMSPALAEATKKAQAGPEPVTASLFKGTGVVVRGQQTGGGVSPSPAIQPAAGGGVVLNFEGADLREVIRNILGDILNENYTIDPAVGGTVTIRTSSGIPRDALPATLETLLRMNGATMVKNGGLYMVVPQALAVRGNVTPQLGGSQRRAAAGLFGADRAAALHRRARDAAAARAVRQGRAGGAPGRAAQPAGALGHRARAAST